MPKQINKNVSQWIEALEKRGRISFSLYQLENELPDCSGVAIRSALKRLSRKGKVVSFHKGFYLIISAQYATRGILPAALFMDNFMKYLNRSYYVGLLSAAALFGSAHQQPQEYFVMTDFPVLRPSLKKGLKVNFISKRNIENRLLKERKTETGYLKVSSACLTACDLVQYEKRAGGLGRVAVVLNELVDEMDPKEFDAVFFSSVPTATVQRLGYLVEEVINRRKLADKLFEASGKNGLKFFRIPLKTSLPVNGYSSGNRWKVIVNSEIVLDE